MLWRSTSSGMWLPSERRTVILIMGCSRRNSASTGSRYSAVNSLAAMVSFLFAALGVRPVLPARPRAGSTIFPHIPGGRGLRQSARPRGKNGQIAAPLARLPACESTGLPPIECGKASRQPAKSSLPGHGQKHFELRQVHCGVPLAELKPSLALLIIITLLMIIIGL